MIKTFFYKTKKKYLWPKVLSLCYHRVKDYLFDPSNITVCKKNFILHLKWLKNNTNILNPDDFKEALLKKNHLPDRSVILTFDDGYDSYEDLIKILNLYGVPAIFFLSTPRFFRIPFYWDILTEELLKPNIITDENYILFEKIFSKINFNKKIEKNLTKNQIQKTKIWKTSDSYINNRTEAYGEISNYLQSMSKNKVDNVLRLIKKVNTNENKRKKLFKIKFLNEHQIGGHTSNHYNLSNLNFDQQKNEIIDNKIFLEKQFSTKIDFFAYPYGQRPFYNKNTVEIVKSFFQVSFSNFRGLIHKDSNRYELPRFLVRDWNLKTFEKNINHYFKSY